MAKIEHIMSVNVDDDEQKHLGANNGGKGSSIDESEY